jgi:hypothetical protein
VDEPARTLESGITGSSRLKDEGDGGDGVDRPAARLPVHGVVQPCSKLVQVGGREASSTPATGATGPSP